MKTGQANGGQRIESAFFRPCAAPVRHDSASPRIGGVASRLGAFFGPRREKTGCGRETIQIALLESRKFAPRLRLADEDSQAWHLSPGISRPSLGLRAKRRRVKRAIRQRPFDGCEGCEAATGRTPKRESGSSPAAVGKMNKAGQLTPSAAFDKRSAAKATDGRGLALFSVAPGQPRMRAAASRAVGGLPAGFGKTCPKADILPPRRKKTTDERQTPNSIRPGQAGRWPSRPSPPSIRPKRAAKRDQRGPENRF